MRSTLESGLTCATTRYTVNVHSTTKLGLAESTAPEFVSRHAKPTRAHMRHQPRLDGLMEPRGSSYVQILRLGLFFFP